MPKKIVIRNEEGVLLNKNGSVNKTSLAHKNGTANLVNTTTISKVQQAVKESKMLDKLPETEEEVDSEEEEVEFEISSIAEKKETANTLAIIDEKLNKISFSKDNKNYEEETKKFLEEQQELSKKEKEELKRQSQDEIRLLKEENQRLKGLGLYNSHLLRINHLAKNVSIKF